jgi:hypothetical protein
LGGYPVLTVSAVKIASQHSEAVGEAARVGVEKRLLFDGIALHATHVSPRDIELATAIEADFANAQLPFGYRTAVSAGIAADTVAIKFLVEVSLADVLVQEIAKGRQGTPRSLPLF